MKFKGYFIKFAKTGVLFPHSIIAEKGYQTIPRQRTILKDYSDSNNDRHRVVHPEPKTKITIKTNEFTETELDDLQTKLRLAYSNATQRRLQLEYWDDELVDYRTANFYLDDITFQPYIKNDVVKYEPITLVFNEK